MGNAELGGAGSLMLTLGTTCPTGGLPVEKLGVNDDVEVEATCSTAGDNRDFDQQLAIGQ